MKIAYNPSGTTLDVNVAPKANDIIFDLNTLDIWAKGSKFERLVSSTLSGSVPSFGTAASGVIDKQADDWVLTRNEDGTVGWYKLPVNAFKNDNTNTTYTLSGALSGNTYVTTLTPSSGSATTATISPMVGATSSSNGAVGLVPAPSSSNAGQFLKGDGTWATPADTHYTTHLYVGAQSSSNNNNSNSATTNGNTYIKLFDNSTLRHQYKIVGTGRVSVVSDANGNITINTPTTIDWTNVEGRPETFAPSGHTHSSRDITSLDDYAEAKNVAALATTDSLNTALGKLEKKANVVYDFYTTHTSEDSNTTIDRLHEIFSVLSGLSETDVIKDIIGQYLPLAGGTLTGALTSQNILPSANNTYSLGSTSAKWSNVYATKFTGNLTGTADVATKLGTATKGSTTKPIYLNAGAPTECNTYAGGTAVTLNGSSKSANTASFYAPTSAGTDGYILESNGSGEPSWVAPSTITSGLSTSLKGGAAGSIPYQNAENSTVFLAGSATNGYVLKYSTTNKAPYWAADTDTNTWRKIQLNGTDILGSATNTNALNFVPGTNVSITNSNGALTISSTDTNTWRGISVQNSEGGSLGSLGNGTDTGTLTLKAGNNVTLSYAGGVVTIASSYTNTDTKVTQTLDDSSNANLRLLLTPSALTATSTNTAKFATDLTYNPNTNMLTAPNLTTTTINGEKVYKKIEKTVSIALKKTWTALTSIDFTSTDFDGDGSYIVQVKNDNYGVWTGYFTVRTSDVVADSTTDDEIILQGGAKSGYNRPYLKTINTSGKVQLSMAYNVDLSTESTWYFYFKRII